MWKSIALVGVCTILLSGLPAPPAMAEGYMASEWDRIARLDKETSGEWSIGVGAHVAHTRGLALDIKYTRPFGKDPWFQWYSKLAAFNGQVAASAGLHWNWSKRFYTGIGIGVTEGNNIIDTAWHYESPIIGWRITPNLSGEFSHRSNCSSFWKFTGDRCLWVLPRGTTPNLGYNFIALRRRF